MDMDLGNRSIPTIGQKFEAGVVDASGRKGMVPITAAVMTPAALEQIGQIVESLIVASLEAPQFARIVENAVHNALVDLKKDKVIQLADRPRD